MNTHKVPIYLTLLLTVLLFNCLGPARGVTNVSAAAVYAIYYVAPEGDCAGMLPCYSSPQDAVDAAPVGSIIRIATGTYTIPAGNSQVLQINKDLILQGGFRITDWFDPQPFTFPTVLDAQHHGRVILIDGNPDDPIDVVLYGIQIKNGLVNQGGGVSGSGVQLTMQRCVVSNNQATDSGGGIFLSDASSLVLESSRIISNIAGNLGGGIALHSITGNSNIIRSWIFGNSAASGGGGISLAGGQVDLKTIILTDNVVTMPTAPGAGLLSDGTQIHLTYTTIAHNTGGNGSGVSLSGASTLTAANLLAAGQTVAISLTAPSTGTVDGVLWGSGTTWGNTANTGGSGSLSIQHAYTGDPIFRELDTANLKTYYHISETSPARDRSVSTTADYKDIDNGTVFATIADLGADEFMTTVGNNTLHVDTEPGGDIEVGDEDGNPENSRGTFFWNGSTWVTNDTAAHMLFTDMQIQDRIKQYTFVADLNGNTPADLDIDDFHVSRSTYTYLVPAVGGGNYQIQAARYRITRSDSDEIILLNSRGNGYGQASFDIYIQNTANTTIAFRSGSAWFNYTETPDLAAQHSISDPTGRAGILTTCDQQLIDRSRYWVDMNGGSDMGGLTYFFHTTSLPNLYSTLGTCYPDEFRIKYMQGAPQYSLEEFRLRPVVYSETFLKSIYLPLVIR
jgi:parallel beta-helix repeat protein